MSTALAPSRPASTRRIAEAEMAAEQNHIVFEDASWSLYEHLLREMSDRPIRMTYDDGRLEVISPLPQHEVGKRAIGRLIEQLTLQLNIPIASFGSTTFRRRDRRKGAEPDEGYYFRDESKMRGRKRLNLQRDPPPDLVVEIDITSPSIPREPIYAAMGVPELWRYDGRRLQCLHLVEGGYRVRKSSLAFPFLKPSGLGRFVNMLGRRDETAIAVAFMDWARKNGCLDR